MAVSAGTTAAATRRRQVRLGRRREGKRRNKCFSTLLLHGPVGAAARWAAELFHREHLLHEYQSIHDRCLSIAGTTLSALLGLVRSVSVREAVRSGSHRLGRPGGVPR
ncbi:hypothetical protein CGL27_40160 [Streptomyces sp. 11-1-2]|nr:hypothetical protein CGL27_40160 [Streptomyces sp. 11-1-2]